MPISQRGFLGKIDDQRFVPAEVLDFTPKERAEPLQNEQYVLKPFGVLERQVSGIPKLVTEVNRLTLVNSSFSCCRQS